MLRVEPLKKVYKVRAPLQLRIWIKNVGNKPVRVQRNLSMEKHDSRLSIFLYDSKHRPLRSRSNKGQGIDRSGDYVLRTKPQSREDFVLLEPGFIYGREIELKDKGYTLPYAGTFYIEAGLSLNDYSRELDFDMWSGDIYSPKVHVRAVK
jgi:hypothetical protein